ncbi:MAG TPA: hypothetical protein DCM45_04800 [Clostridiales bacterium]|nr:hypothetical protein [Clostridiales bacterium]
MKSAIKNSRWFLISLMISFLLPLLISFPVYADFGPKPSITIIVKNPPADEYYLDLLINENKSDNSQIEDKEKLDPIKYALLENYNVEGWQPALVHGTSIPLFGHLTGIRQGQDMEHTFSYFGTPDNFKIIIVTPDNQVVVSPEISRKSFQLTLSYDYASGTIRQPSLVVAYLLQFLSTLIPTLIIEGLLLLLFRFSLKRSFWPFLIVNLATQILLTAILGTALITQGVFAAILLSLPVELVIIVAETIAFSFLLKEHRKGRRIGFAITANIVSYIASLIVMLI